METTNELYRPLIDNITSIVNISGEQLEKVVQAFEIKKLKKKEYLLQPGMVSNHMRFVTTGCIRVYALEDTQEVISQFGVPGWWVNDLYSFLTHTPATQYIQTTQASIVLMLHRDVLERLYNEVPPIERFFRIKFQNAYTALQERHLKNISLSALERYQEFRRRYRNIEQSVPQYMIASYLGITKEFLSALRKEM